MSSRVRQPATAALRCARQAWKVQYNDTARSLALAEQALARALARGDVEAEGWARLTLGHYRLRYASPSEALVELEAAQRCLSASGDRRGEIMAQVAQAR
ncbi:MAG TPA: GGDEF domain-containing protein, partial [Burkholderiaceae bacterium]|nr:GGDEF domain-containing protein [Burkholderiaceae bacterium]